MDNLAYGAIYELMFLFFEYDDSSIREDQVLFSLRNFLYDLAKLKEEESSREPLIEAISNECDGFQKEEFQKVLAHLKEKAKKIMNDADQPYVDCLEDVNSNLDKLFSFKLNA